jgi:TetR/AcrR family transcriptional repressor of nem operon
MRFEKGHKEATRQRIIETASARFRKDGVAATGIAGLMADAGLTHGGFYAHFASKEELVGEATAAALLGAKSRVVLEEAGLEAFIRSYLRKAHRDTPEQGCAAAALAPEIARNGETTRANFAEGLEEIFARIAKKLPDNVPYPARWETAVGIFGVMMGTLQLARAVLDKKLSDRILESGIAAALRLADASATASGDTQPPA